MSASDKDSIYTTQAQGAGGAPRMFGRLQLLRLLGKSQRSMAWLAADRAGNEMMLVLPRVQPPDATSRERWRDTMRRTSRLQHPNIANPTEVGFQDGWPYAAYDMRGRATLADRTPKKGLPGLEAATIVVQALRGLAYAHEAGFAHQDLQRHLLIVDDQGQTQITGVSVASETPIDGGQGAASARGGGDPSLSTQRANAETDVLATGLVMHGLIAGVPALEEPDIGRAVLRMPPIGREIVRLPWTGAHPTPEALRAIVNRATDRQQRQRYRGARTLLHALEGWLQTESASGGGALALLSDRLAAAGVLPASSGAGARGARLAAMDRERTNQLAEVVLEDLALTFEILRSVNSVQVRGAQGAGSGPVLAVRRAIAMVGIDGVRRAASALREWPGPLDDAGAAELEALIARCKRAGRIAMALQPPGYDGEVVYLLTLLQNLGRLVVHYHFADDARQIHRLMQPAPPQREGEQPEPGMTEEGAAFAVLGADIEAIGAAVAKWWGLDESVLAMVRRVPPEAPVHTPETDDEMLRLVASCANETVDASTLPPQRSLLALQRVVQRYGRSLGVALRDLQAILQEPSPGGQQPIAQTAPAPLEDADTPAASAAGRTATAAAAAAGGLRSAAALRATR